MKSNSFILLIIVGMVLLLQPVGALAQDNRDTGRHKPKPKPKKEIVQTSTSHEGKPGTFHIGMLVGTSMGSDLFSASTVSGNSISWATVGGGSFNSSRFSTELHRNLKVGFLGRYVYSPGQHNGSAFRLGLDFSELEILAQALTGQVGSLLLYDRASIFNVGLGWEYPLADLASFPFVGVEVLASFFSADMGSELQQTNAGGRVIFGYHFNFNKTMGLRFEGRLSRTLWGTGDFLPPTEFDTALPIEVSGEENISYFDLLVGVEIGL